MGREESDPIQTAHTSLQGQHETQKQTARTLGLKGKEDAILKAMKRDRGIVIAPERSQRAKKEAYNQRKCSFN